MVWCLSVCDTRQHTRRDSQGGSMRCGWRIFRLDSSDDWRATYILMFMVNQFSNPIGQRTDCLHGCSFLSTLYGRAKTTARIHRPNSPNDDRFQNSFHVKLNSKSVINLSLKIASRLKRVATYYLAKHLAPFWLTLANGEGRFLEPPCSLYILYAHASISSPWCCRLTVASLLSSVSVFVIWTSLLAFLASSQLATVTWPSFAASDAPFSFIFANSLGGRLRRYGRRSSAGGGAWSTGLVLLYAGAGSCRSFHFPVDRRFLEYRMLSTSAVLSRSFCVESCCCRSTFGDVSLSSHWCFDLSLSLYRLFVACLRCCLTVVVSFAKLLVCWLYFSLLPLVAALLSPLVFTDLS